MNLEEKILEKIKEKQLKPKSFWFFLIRDYTLWGLVFISIIFAAISIAPIIFILQNLELGYVKHLTDNIYLFILFILPYPWIILCALTTYLATLAWERTKNGYRFDGKKVLTISLLASLILGILLNLWNFGKRIDDEFRNVSFGSYKSFEERRSGFWFDPDKGKFIGKIDQIDNNNFTLVNLKNNYSKVITFDETTLGSEHLQINNHVRVVGYENFACAVFPDNLKPNNKNNPRKEVEKKIINTTSETEENKLIHDQCKNIFEKGRAFFKPPQHENNLK